MSGKWAEFAEAIYDAQSLMHWVKDHRSLDEVTKKMMDSVIVKIKFVYVFVSYVHRWSDIASLSQSSSSSLSSSYNTEVDSLLIKVAAAPKEFKTFILHDFIHIFRNEPTPLDQKKFTTKLIKWLRTATWRLFRSKSSELLHILTSLDKKISLLELKIREGNYYGSLSTLSCHFHLPPSRTNNFAWYHFCHSLEFNLRYFSEGGSRLSHCSYPLGMDMKALEQMLISLRWFLSSDDHDWSPWRDNMRAHFGGTVIQVAHLCCFCWYNAPLAQNLTQEIAISLSNLHCLMDPDSPKFLEIAIGCLGHYDGKDSEKSISSFVYYIHGERNETEVLHKELVSLFTHFIKIPEMHLMHNQRILVGIKDVATEAKNLTYRCKRKHYSSFAILFAEIWFLKAEISIKSSSNSKDDHVEALHEGCRYLEKILSPTDEKTVEYQLWKIIKGVPDHVECLYQSSHEADVKVRNLLYNSLVQLKLLKSNALVLELLKKDADLLLPLKHKIETLFREGLCFMIDVMNNKTKEFTEDEKKILIDIEVVAAGVLSLRNTFPVDNLNLTEDGVKNMDDLLVDMLVKVEHFKSKLKGLYLQQNVIRFNLPKTPGLCFIEFLSHHLRDRLNRKHDSVAYAAHQIEAICRDLEIILLRFRDVLEQDFEKQESKDLLTRLVNVMYQAEHVIGCTAGEDMAVSQQILWLYHLSEEIRDIKIQLTNFVLNYYYSDGVHNVQRLVSVVSHVSVSLNQAVMVGLIDEKVKITDRLIKGTTNRDIISIVGMPGIGKTTLANNVFFSPGVMYHFPVRAWCCVSQAYKKRDLLLDILSHIITVTDNTHTMSDDDLHLMLYRHLKKRRYLIVMDDMWSTGAWDDLQLSFPDDSNGSRILLTSRLQNVVTKISDPHPLRPLSEEESWKMLKIKIFQGEECPEELLEVGQEIAKNCNGLPLAIGAIAGLLDKTGRKSQDLWKKIAERVSSQIVNDPESQCKKILELSYEHLPDHLKACFLYLGAFPKDRDIPVQRLRWLWIAEGFVRKLECKSLEDLAEDYLMDLVGRSLVMVAKRSSNGEVKACRLHDVVRDLCLLRAKDEFFSQLISSTDEPYSSFDGFAHDVPLELLNISNSRAYEEYRLCFCVNREQFVASRPSGPFVRSLLFFASTDMYPRCPYDVSFIPNNYKRLRVLDLESINMGSSLANGIELLVDLRYLAVCGDMESIPSSLSNLEDLETLLVKGLKRKVVLPETIWRMTKLRHIHVTDFAIFALNLQQDHYAKDGSSSYSQSQLFNLVSLSFPCVNSGEAMNEMIMRCPNLRKLKCKFLQVSDLFLNFHKFPALESLCKLEFLKISYYGKFINTLELNFPSNLKKLTLSNFRLPWSHISAIGKLHNLEVLKLISRAFEGSSWDMTEGEFVNLKYLKLDMLDIVQWNAYSEHLPQLQQLVLKNCKKLEEVPFDFVCISTLQKIEVEECAISVEDSVRRIADEEIEGLKIVVNKAYSPAALLY